MHSDVKPGKTSALRQIKDTIEKVKGIGIGMSKELFDEITQAKNIYIKFVSYNKMMNATEETDDMIEMKRQIRGLCSRYLPVTESILLHWSESAIELEEQYGSIQDVLALVAGGPRRGRGRGGRGRRVVRKRPAPQ
jgi:hypothetical protein